VLCLAPKLGGPNNPGVGSGWATVPGIGTIGIADEGGPSGAGGVNVCMAGAGQAPAAVACRLGRALAPQSRAAVPAGLVPVSALGICSMALLCSAIVEFRVRSRLCSRATLALSSWSSALAFVLSLAASSSLLVDSSKDLLNSSTRASSSTTLEDELLSSSMSILLVLVSRSTSSSFPSFSSSPA